MTRFFFFITTLMIGAFLQFFCNRYLSLANASPDVFLLLTAAFGFAGGPVLGQLIGFFWGLLGDTTGSEMFGLSSLVLTLVGFIAGLLRRRVASERLTGQLVVAVVATIFYASLSAFLLSAFDAGVRVRLIDVLIEAAMNVIFVPWLFMGAERWMDAWAVEREHV